MVRTGVRIKTYNFAGKYNHDVYDLGINGGSLQLSDEIVEMQKKINEKLWEEADNPRLIESKILLWED
jgi:hypothetical protein